MRKASSQVRAWAMYDWANSAYVLTTVTAVLPAYFATAVVPEAGAVLLGVRLAAPTLWGLMVGSAALLIFLLAPVLGAAADFTGSKRAFLASFCLAGSACAFLLGFSGPGDVWRTASLFMLAQVGFAGANVFYDAFLPVVSPPGKTDWVSGLGFAWGYIGGGLHFLASLLLIQFAGALGLDQGQAARIALATAALWWAGFAMPALIKLREDKPVYELPREYRGLPKPLAVLRVGLSLAAGTLRTLASRTERRGAGLFLLAFLLYNDGIQTVIAMATMYGKDELNLPMSALMLTLLLIQAVAFGGALLFSRLAERITTRRALLLSLLMWSSVVCYAYFIDSSLEYFILGALVGLVLGGSQALSRSLFAVMIPKEQSARYFGYFSVVNKLSAIGGPFLFAAIRHMTGSSRDAILGVLVLFVVGMALLWRVRQPEQEIVQA
ncbi:major facilitator superfamily permease [Desulfocurvibacter africanus PCS]|uniref:Major facilitator superfamily permease n=1 Tax=Desulfocurvibacter africanus PCS TaxID=1262666 RepID=M5PS82_DESAF|nr:MFS transporter [Desulfocurvibacter africanus]EMG36920.1 major facilitator superfamily permease [Desulfocurvibacter africanus PCS]